MPLDDDVIQQLRVNDRLYARRCLKVVDEGAEKVPLLYRPAQIKLSRARAEQRRRGLPVRIIVLKSRKTGISTEVQGWAVQETTLNENRNALIVAHDLDTAGELFDIADVMYTNLPGHLDDRLKPGTAEYRPAKSGRKYFRFGQPAKELRAMGDVGVNSRLAVDTAGNVEGGRGKTLHFLHGSEVAFWDDPKKLLGLLNTVPDHPNTTIVLESTANGHNHFKRRVDRAERGEGSYTLVFIGWPEDPACHRPFPDPDERARFIADVGKGPWGEDEPRLIREFGCTPEQLYWRRNAIVDKADGILPDFMQEYPASSEEAFMGSGRHRFSMQFISKVVDRTKRLDPEERPIGDPIEGVHVPPLEGIFTASGYKTRNLHRETVEVPTGAIWTPRSATGFKPDHPWWRVWEEPTDEGQYIIVCDPAQGEENTVGESDYHGVQVMNHKTGEQVARYRSKVDPDMLADELFLAGLYWNTALIAVEITGGHGMPVVKTYLWKKLGYSAGRLYQRKREEGRADRQEDRFGWSTDRKTKPWIEDEFAEVLREETTGIRDRVTALELTTFVKDERGRTGAEPEAYDDLLMAWMIAHHIRRTVRPRPAKKPGAGRGASSLTRTLPPEWQR